MEQVSIKRFTQPAQPFAPLKGPLRTFQPMREVPKVKRPVGRPRKRPRNDPEILVEQTETDHGEAESQLSTMSDSADRLKTASKQEICQWAIKAQNHLSAHPEMVIKSFKITGISLA